MERTAGVLKVHGAVSVETKQGFKEDESQYADPALETMFRHDRRVFYDIECCVDRICGSLKPYLTFCGDVTLKTLVLN